MLHSNWETNRPGLFANIVCCQAPPAPNQLCSICQVLPAVLRCIECGMQQFLCTSCDDRTHEKCPTHDRQAWINGYYQYILPTQTVNAESGEIVNMGRQIIIRILCILSTGTKLGGLYKHAGIHLCMHTYHKFQKSIINFQDGTYLIIHPMQACHKKAGSTGILINLMLFNSACYAASANQH